MNTIHKYPFEIVDQQTIEICKPAIFRHIGLDPQGDPCIWAEVYPGRDFNTMELFVVGTGHPIPTGALTFLGSFNQGPFMWHVYTN